MKKLVIDGLSLTLKDVKGVARDDVKVSLSSLARERCKESARWIEEKVREGTPIYGVNTGFGSKENVRIPDDEIEKLQRNLILSHSAGVGNIVERDIVRAMMLLRANTLSIGYSGVRPSLIDTILSLLNNDIYPSVPEKGSVGASGDLCPLSHLALLLIGEGEAFCKGRRMKADKVLREIGISPLTLAPKEGLALINGNQFSTAIGALTLYDFESVFASALISSSLAFEALLGHRDVFNRSYLNARPHNDVLEVSESILKLIQESNLVGSDNSHIQDGYSLRCIPQVYGTVLSSARWVKQIFQNELNSATDNPLIFSSAGKAISGGNFHGEPLSVAMDLLGIVMANLGNIIERQIARLLFSHLSKGLPSFLAKREGVESGYMLAQYTAAALVSENKVLSHPASVDSIPTSEGQEDYVSMAPIAARKASEILKNIKTIIAIELLCAAEAIDIRTKGDYSLLGKGTHIAQNLIREDIPPLSTDRIISEDIKAMESLLDRDFSPQVLYFRL
ncbi:histidine ammonia-lyase [candidate division WOR-3 bacterium]|nr:histidine ammonia-lyase [candidate division WOR-3 bacterium]